MWYTHSTLPEEAKSPNLWIGFHLTIYSSMVCARGRNCVKCTTMLLRIFDLIYFLSKSWNRVTWLKSYTPVMGPFFYPFPEVDDYSWLLPWHSRRVPPKIDTTFHWPRCSWPKWSFTSTIKWESYHIHINKLFTIRKHYHTQLFLKCIYILKQYPQYSLQKHLP